MAVARSRGRRWLIGLAILLGVAVWCVVAAAALLDARRQAQAGFDHLSAARGHLGATALVRGEAADDVAVAQRDFSRAHERADSWVLAPLRYLPVVGRQVRSVDALTASAARVSGVGAGAMRESRRRVDAHPQGGPARVQLVEQLGGIAGRSRAQLGSVDLGPANALLGPLASARDRFARELGRLRNGLTDVRDSAAGLAPLLRGPSRYLVFAANNAEMRAGSGMFLSVGVLTFDNGSFSLSEMTPTRELTLPPGAVPITGDFAARWGWTHPNEEWRNLAMTPRFDASASLAVQMWKYRTGTDVDGVLAIDAIALQALLAVTGPVQVEGQTIGADSVVSEVLLDQYRTAAASAAGYDEVQQARQERLSAIARATVAALDQTGWDASVLEQLQNAAAGRHLLAWSSRPDQERAWRAAGIAGELRPDSMLLAVLNRGGNKLDQFLDVQAGVEAAPREAATDVAVRVTLTNTTPAGLPDYVAGPYPGRLYAPGTYVGIFSLDVPGASRDISIDDGAPLVAAGPDGPARVVATNFELAPGEHRDLVVRFSLPAGVAAIRVEPTARIPRVRWTQGSVSWVDGDARTIHP